MPPMKRVNDGRWGGMIRQIADDDPAAIAAGDGDDGNDDDI
jgi:hypothetical protein